MNEKAISTASGMWGLWDYAEYITVTSYTEWENLFCEDEDIKKQIIKNKFVPIYIHSDGCFQFRVKLDEALNDREKQYVLVQSEEYLFDTSGKAILSGIENIDKAFSDENGISLDLKPGKYRVSICLIEWDMEPNMKLSDGGPHPEALPDFIILIRSNISNDKKQFRQDIETFNE